MEGVTPPGRPALRPTSPLPGPADREDPSPAEPPASEASGLPPVDWRPWMAPVALIGGLVLAAIGGLVVDLPALALGVHLTTSHTPPGLAIADTFVQDVAFVLAAVFCAQIGGRTVRAWQFGLRPPRPGWLKLPGRTLRLSGWVRATGLISALILLFIAFNAIWVTVFEPGKEKILQQLGSNESTLLLVLSAGLTCVIAPIAEEFLFRGFIFTALSRWRGAIPAALITGVLFGAVHAGSAPALDLVPLAALGFALCLLYRRTGSLYPGIVTHSLNNSIAFGALENWEGEEFVLLIVASLAAIWALVQLFKRAGVIGPQVIPVIHSP
jgi:membrane protease YdiL (CAAX protease family)